MFFFDPSLPEYARNIQELTAKSGLSQAEIARRARLPRDAFGRYHNGVTQPPAHKIVAIAQVFGVKPSDISAEFAHLDDAKPTDSGARPAYSITPSATGRAGDVYLEVATDVPAGVAAQIIELLVAATAKTSKT